MYSLDYPRINTLPSGRTFKIQLETGKISTTFDRFRPLSIITVEIDDIKFRPPIFKVKILIFKYR